VIRLTKENLAKIPDKHGVYWMYAHDLNKNPIHIQRFAKKDKTGLIYIGRTHKQGLRKRISNFFYTIKEASNTTNHSGALKYRNRLIIQSCLGSHNLYLTFETSETPVVRENDLLKEYAEEFGEYPLLNK